MEASAARSHARRQHGSSADRVTETFTLAHLSDPHLTSLDSVQPQQLLNKRLMGYLSWRRKRRHEHRREVIDALLTDMQDQVPEHLVITGDLTHLGTPAECQEARRWLRRLGPPERVTVVPGNHDAYARDAWADTIGQWSPYMRGDRQQDLGPEDFPCLRRRGPLALIGVNTARPTLPLMATGRVGDAQLERLREQLLQTREEDRCRVLLLHHPVNNGVVSRRKELDDAAALREVLAETGAELILHGHGHEGGQHTVDGPDGLSIPVLAAPSASAVGDHSREQAGYLRISISRPAGAQPWQIDVDLRRYDREHHCFRRQDQQRLHSGLAAQD